MPSCFFPVLDFFLTFAEVVQDLLPCVCSVFFKTITIPQMKNQLTLLISLLLALTVQAQTGGKPQRWPSFLNLSQVPNGVAYLPAPPDTSSVQFLNDKARFLWGKQQRLTARGREAVADADQSVEALLRQFSPAMGFEMSRSSTPQLYALVERLDTDGGNSIRKAKDHDRRPRPFVLFHDSTAIPEVEPRYRRTYSYPSGHSATGWCIALVLAELNPLRQELILKRGYEIGESRVIAGFHYQSDVDAARLAGSAVVARLHADKKFQRQLRRARKEVKKFTKGH